MPSPTTALDYALAVKQAAKGRLAAYPHAIRSVLTARFRHGLGPRMHSLFRLYEEPLDTWDRFLLDERLRTVLRRLNPIEHRAVVNNKGQFFDHCTLHGLPTIPVLCTLEAPGKEAATAIDISKLTPPQAFLDCLEGTHPRLFFKLASGTWGMHAFVAARREGVWDFHERRGTAEAVFHYCMRLVEGRRNWIVQPVIEVHPALLEVTSRSALSTVRAITWLVGGKASLHYAVLRIPVGKNVTDNFAHGRSGNILAPIRLDTGTLGTGVGSAERRWPKIVEFPCHPDTGQPIEGFRLPHWDAAKEILLRAHQTLPELKTIGWDLAITEQGPLIVEANATYDVDLIQVAHGRGIGHEVVPLLNSVQHAVLRSGQME